MKINVLYTLIFVSFSFLSSCKKEEISIQRIPSIQFSSINSMEFISFNDSVILEISYKDDDGDIGYENADLPSIFVKDNRLSEFDSYYCPPLSPTNSNVPIKGNLRIKLPPLFLLGNTSKETTFFEIYIVDRANNKSNIVFSPEVSIKE
jgi:hypothetical protein